MEIIVKINEFADLDNLVLADAYLIANKHLSYRYDHSFNLTEIKKIKNYCLKRNKKIYILINKIFHEDEINSLKITIKKLIDINVDGFFFADFAVFMISSMFHFENKCFFYHETFLRNSYDILTYQELGIKNIICSKDMHLDDLLKLPLENKKHLGIMCFGYVSLYESERKVLSNFVTSNNLDKSLVNLKTLYLKEDTRDNLYPILQQDGHTFIFDDKIWCYLEKFKILNEHLHYFIFDSLFLSSTYINFIIALFKKSLQENITIDDLKAIDESKEFTTGFLTTRVGLT